MRNIISEVLAQKLSPNWLQDPKHGLGADRVKELQKKQKEEEGRRYTKLIDQDLLAYTDFGDLREILDKNKKFFEPIFKDWDTFKVYLKKVEYLRNPAKHHRFLYDYEILLLQGIAGEIEDNINAWYIGTRFQIKKYRFNFFEYIPTEGKNEEQILKLSKAIGKNWIEKMNNFFRDQGIEQSAIKVQEGDFKGSISAAHIRAQWQTSPSAHPNSNIGGIHYKSIELKLWYSLNSPLNLDELIEIINKKYFLFAFELDGRIDINRLMNIAENIAGLKPSSAGGTGKNDNIIYGRVEYGIATFWIIGVSNIDQKTSEIYIQANDKFSFKTAHKVITFGTLLSYLTGNILRRVMISLIKSSL
ncbi:MAG: hypothetical protein AB1410_00195 [Acidobacteriota bacterium]